MKKKTKAIVTGVAGFAGSYLAELLLLKGINVFGLVAPKEKLDNISSIKSGLEIERFDILNADKMNKYINKVKPDYIFHLAAIASVGRSFGTTRKVYDVNFTGSLNVFESASALKSLKKMIFISSSDVYGIFKPARKILDEKQPLNPVSPYGISKAAGEHLAQYYVKNKNVP
ncbi:MAG: NAD-dependent epimerase/dehydratase family protein, partial [candidate division Zixibacteria bacterium]|nr:NAD-dependent epimerase/dehydratase family protein [candidate division Zixibacteria bacterium]